MTGAALFACDGDVGAEDANVCEQTVASNCIASSFCCLVGFGQWQSILDVSETYTTITITGKFY